MGLNAAITSLQFGPETILSSMDQVGVWIKWPLMSRFHSKSLQCYYLLSDMWTLLSVSSENLHPPNSIKIP